MTFLSVGKLSRDEDLQDRCWGAIMHTVPQILAATLNTGPGVAGSMMSGAGYDLTCEKSKNMAGRFARLTHLSTPRTISTLILLNSAIADNPVSCLDGDIEYQLWQIWATLVDIG